MALPDPIAAQIDALAPAGRAVVMLMWPIQEQQSEDLRRLREELAQRARLAEKNARPTELQAQNEKLTPLPTVRDHTPETVSIMLAERARRMRLPRRNFATAKSGAIE